MKIRLRFWLPLWVFALIVPVMLTAVIRDRSRASFLKEDIRESSLFREQELKPELYEELLKMSEAEGDFSELLTAAMLNGKMKPEKLNTDREPYLRYKREAFYQLQKCYQAVWSDVRCFPVPSKEISFENTWFEKRTYGGERVHEGTDLFGRNPLSGYYPVFSMTDGTVEQIGWLPLGGYRIGIRSPHGGYFYYAHLAGYEREFYQGETVQAGQILGFMGNTGYGAEGTSGRFPVHLHLGIYISAPDGRELSVNPYWVLAASDKKIINYAY